MYAAFSPCDPEPTSPARPQRVDAAAGVSFKHLDGQTRIARLYQQGSAKIRLPRTHQGMKEAVLINTAGGLTGGDRISWDVELGAGAQVAVSTQACEKVYRSSQGTAVMDVRISLGRDASCHWLPQETIVYNCSSLSRSLTVDLDAGARFVGLEAVVLGRQAMGERAQDIRFRDRWRIRREGVLVHADDVLLTNSALSSAQLSGNRVMASLVVLDGADAEQCEALADSLRQVCPAPVSGFSGLAGKVTGRVLAQDSYQLRAALIPILKHLRGCDLPRVWRT